MRMPKLEGIKSEHLELYWPHVERWIAAAIKDAGHCWTASDLKRELERELLQLWVIWLDGAMQGCICTHVFESPRGKTCAMPVVYCSDMEACIDVLSVIEAWAKSIDGGSGAPGIIIITYTLATATGRSFGMVFG